MIYILALHIFAIKFNVILLLGLGIVSITYARSRSADPLLECWTRQVKPLQELYLTFTYKEQLNELDHGFEPWAQINYQGNGNVWVNVNNFLKDDSLLNIKKNELSYSKTQLSITELLLVDYNDKDLHTVTREMFLDQTFKSARYSPVILINYFFHHKITIEPESDHEFAVYKTTISKTIVEIFIRKTDSHLDKITTMHYDELYGDVISAYTYKKYLTIHELLFPTLIMVEKMNGRMKEEVEIATFEIINNPPSLLEKPKGYEMKEGKKIIPEIAIEKFNNNIYFIELKHTDAKVMLVEFADFLLVAVAPLNSENGELIIAEAKKIVPHKPIRYFTFGHHHPHLLGGMRPFIHIGAKILCIKENEAYVRHLAAAPHSLNPDSLQIEPRPLLIEEVEEYKLITDGIFELQIYDIGNKSAHTNDYLIYYFPSEQLLFQEDLVWIKREGEIGKARDRQEGLYKAVKELGLDIKTIVQSWPVREHGIKTVIPFAELEKSIQIE